MADKLTRRALLGALSCFSLVGSSTFVRAEDGEDAVVIFDRLRDPAHPGIPMLTIFRDGKMLYRAAPGVQKEADQPMSAEALAALQQQLRDTFRILEIDAGEIKREIDRLKSTGRLFLIADAPTTRLTVDLPEGSNTIELFASSLAADTFPEIEALSRLNEAESLLMEIYLGLL